MPAQADLDRLRSIKTLPSLIAYLRDELDWPVDQNAIEDDVTYDYAPEELGFDAATAVHIKEIKQLRPLDSRQPWGIFWVNFEKKRLPVVMLRRILGHLVLKKRADAKKASQRAWHLHDLLFISAYGEESDRAITFAHFSQPSDSPGDLPALKVLGWDDGDTVLHLVDAHRTLAEKLRWPSKPADIEAWRAQWSSAFTLCHREVISTTTELVEELARLADATRRRARSILARESERGPLRRLYAAFKAALIHDLTEDDFADVIAQTISYGLLIARFSRASISAQNLVDMVPATNPFLRELLGTFLALAGRQSAFDFDELGIQDVVEVLNRANADAVKTDFGNRTRDEDPVIHFYEHFLAAYDRQKKIQRGVFYTPQPVVSYVVRSVHEFLQKEFGIEEGLASTITWGDMLKTHPDLKLPKIRVPKAGKAEGEEVDLSPDEFFVMILDIATGTGTFLDETIEVIFQHLQAKWAKHGLQGMPIIRHNALRIPSFKDYWNAYVPAALLPRLYGFELMMAPYTIAHMKLGLKLSEINARLGQPDYLFKFEGRAHIYLTNTLEPPSGFQTQQFADFFPALAHEAAAVNTVKRTKRFTIALGNPPYSGHSANNGEWICNLLDDYYYVDGVPLGERNPKWLQDDYVKFIRLGQNLVTQAGAGCLAYITNHSYLDNPTFRGMRRSLMTSFNRINVIDLHGNSKKREVNPAGGKDENVFDIQQGVAVCLMRQNPSLSRSLKHVDLFGVREAKYRALASGHPILASFSELAASPPLYLFIPQNENLKTEFEKHPAITQVMPVNVLGFQSHRDHFAIAFTREEILKRMKAFRDKRWTDREVSDQFVVPDNRDWQVSSARKLLQNDPQWERSLIRVAYRPLDFRYACFSEAAMDYPRKELLRHVAGHQNLCLNTTRQTRAQDWRNALVSDCPTPAVFVELKDGSNVFPLWLYPDEDELGLTNTRTANFSPDFLQDLASSLKLERDKKSGLPKGISAEHIFFFIYATLYSTNYRRRYGSMLRMGFPRVPLPPNPETFKNLAALGESLTTAHLLKPSPQDRLPSLRLSAGNNEVTRVRYEQNRTYIGAVPKARIL
jgi:predicted helicase